MGDKQLALHGVCSIQPTMPLFPRSFVGRLEQGLVLASSSRHKKTMASQQSTVFAQALLDVGRGGLVHAHMQHHSSLDGWLRGHERLNGG